MLEKIRGSGLTKHLHNTGGPRSRTRSLRIQSTYTDHLSIKPEATVVSVYIPKGITDLEAWLSDQAKMMGCNDIAEVEQMIPLPLDKLLVSKNDNDPANEKLSAAETLRNALILARTNASFYRPDSPLIFTKSRLHRSLQLIKINIKHYYELD